MRDLTMTTMSIFAQAGTAVPSGPSVGDVLLHHLLAAVVFASVGLVCLGLCLWIAGKVSPFPLRKELEEDQNMAVALILAAVILGMSLIIAAAIHG